MESTIRVSRSTYVEFRNDAGKINGTDLLLGVTNAFLHAIYILLPVNSMAFTTLSENRGQYTPI